MRKRGIAESCASTKYPPSPAGGCPGALPLAGASPGRATSAQDRAPLENLHEKLAKKGSVVVRGENAVEFRGQKAADLRTTEQGF